MESKFDLHFIEHGYGNRFQGFQNLMRLRIRNILIVSSLYDLYVFEEDGKLYELIRNETRALNLSHAPELTRVSSGYDALRILQDDNKFDLIITTLHIEDIGVIEFAEKVKKARINIPIVLLAYDNRELQSLMANKDIGIFDKIFMWLGDFRIILAIVQYLEDRMNVEHDTKIVGVQSIIVIEDSIRYYSSMEYVIYLEILRQTQRLISEGINLSHKHLRRRARPKILLCSSYEEGWDYYNKYRENILGIICDVEFPQKGKINPCAGIEYTAAIRNGGDEVPILILSQSEESREAVEKLGASFLFKYHPQLHEELRMFMNHHFSFGNFVFRTFEGREVGRARNLRELEEKLATVPEESIRYHAERNHFSTWLKARTEFWLAHQLRPRKVSEFATIGDLRRNLIESLIDYREKRRLGIIDEFDKENFDPDYSFSKIGHGSIGGKARGLGFVNTLINNYNIQHKFDGVKIGIPAGVVVATHVFDQFLELNNLRKFAMECNDDLEITRRFVNAEKFPEDILAELAAFLDFVHEPLAVRSSSVLEDSQYHPFAGVYETYMIPNNQPYPLLRLNELLNAIKSVYASTFYQSAKSYIKITSFRCEEEKMAVIIQKIVGHNYQGRFYPDFSGVAKSHNFYPLPPQKSSDGIALVALGLGKTVVEGGLSARFCPKYPADLLNIASVSDTLKNSQSKFFALKMNTESYFGKTTTDNLIQQYHIAGAEEDGTLKYSASTYLPESEAIYEGLSRKGPRVITFEPILKNNLFPLARILDLLLDMGAWGMGTPVEIEFAVNMKTEPAEFGFLQMRPLVTRFDSEYLTIREYEESELICKTNKVLGHGIIDNIYDIVYVDYDLFERSKSIEVAAEISSFNNMLNAEGRPYLLIGLGRWGSRDPWLGIPVTWDQISGAKVIVESSFKDLVVQPSQGTHFFQNLTSFMVGYFTIDQNQNSCSLNWDWLKSISPAGEKIYTKHIRFDKPILVKMNYHQNIGVIIKPE